MDNNLYYENQYTYNGLNYNIIDALEVHEKLQNDNVFFQSYMKSNLGCLEVTGAIDNNTSESNEHNTSITVDANNTFHSAIEEDKQQWTVKATKLLLELYKERKEKFRDPKVKNRNLWTDIVHEMNKKGYKRLNEDILDRKLRNLKKTFRTIKDNNRKNSTGRGRIRWEYYDIFEDLYSEDQTINFGPTISSMDPAITQFSSCASPSTSTILSPTAISTSTSSVSFSTRIDSVPTTPNQLSHIRTPSPALTSRRHCEHQRSRGYTSSLARAFRPRKLWIRSSTCKQFSS
ncbi:uncharacterized protein LOC105278985 isoform X2 [Ooceraea biroi]|uniref:uncharacterized protein LOC105278985 isoform X2 n=1 Tax=Ooceraea biroi TaxID=2015173 RepID=UPI000F08B612|nr:uncharacterized protein LOC105278985 isoform X2 [Ooceraea biroi]